MQIHSLHKVSDSAISLSVIVPMYNEEARIEKTLRDLREYFESPASSSIGRHEIILVDDGSTDDTVRKVDSLAADLPTLAIRVISLGSNRGKGRAVKVGVLAGSMDHVLYMDADDAVSVFELERLLAYMTTYDMIIGGRVAHAAGSSLARSAISATGRLLNRTLVTGIRDTQCPFKLMSSAVARELFSKTTIDRYAFDLELLFLAQISGYSIKEVSVRYVSVTGSKFRIIKDVFNAFVDFCRIHLNRLTGAYDRNRQS